MNMPVKVNFGVKGFFKLEAVTPGVDGAPDKTRLLADWFPNLITDSGMDQLAVGGMLVFCRVGSGNTAPTFADTTLVSQVAGTNSRTASSTATSSSPYYTALTVVYTFAVGAAAGNLSEIGISNTLTSNLTSRALILDGTGAPTTITVLSTEILQATYQFRTYRFETDRNATVVISGVSYTTVTRSATIANAVGLSDYGPWGPSVICQVSNGVLGAITGSITGTKYGQDSLAQGAYTLGTWQRSVSATFGISAGNAAGGVTAASFTTNGTDQIQTSFSPAIPKDNTKSMTLSWLFSWVRH